MGRTFRVAHFPAPFIGLLRKAAQERLEFKMPYRDAVRRRHALYRLRTAMKQENHFLSDAVLGCCIRIVPPVVEDKDTIVSMILEPLENEFLGMLEDVSGLEIQDPPPEADEEEPEEEDEDEPSTEGFDIL